MKKIIFSLLVCALLLSACGTTPAPKASETATLTPTFNPVTSTETTTPTKTPTITNEAPIVMSTESPIEIPTMTFKDASGKEILDTDSEPFSVKVFDTIQEGLNEISKNAKWLIKANRTGYLGDFWSLKNEKAVEFAKLIKQIPGVKPLFASTYPGKGDTFVVLSVSQINNGALLIFQNNNGDYSAIYSKEGPGCISVGICTVPVPAVLQP